MDTQIIIDSLTVTQILTSLTALAAVIGPIVSAIITVRSNERAKRLDLYAPQLYAAVQKLSDTYAALPRKRNFQNTGTYQRTTINEESYLQYRAFSAAAYEVMALFSSPEIHTQIKALLESTKDVALIETKHDLAFQTLSEALADELSSWVVSGKHRHTRKKQRKTGK